MEDSEDREPSHAEIAAQCDDKSRENRLVLRNNSDDMGGAPMGTVALVILGWIAANLVIGAVWTIYCVWPRGRAADASVHSVFRRTL